MRDRHCLRSLAVGATMGFAILTSLSAASVVLNGGFESGTAADADNWAQLVTAGGNQGASATVDRVMSDANSGSHSMSLIVVGAGDFGPVAEIQQQTLVGTVVPGLAYDFSFFSRGVAGPGTVGFYEMSWFDGDGSDGGGPKGSATGLSQFSLLGVYAQNSHLNLIAPVGADSVFVSIRLVTGAFAGAQGSASIDDVSFTLVPEPTSLGLIALSGGLLAARRRRHQA